MWDNTKVVVSLNMYSFSRAYECFFMMLMIMLLSMHIPAAVCYFLCSSAEGKGGRAESYNQ